MFDLAVIGTGIMGAPTAWHAQRSGASVVAIGVLEPAEPDQHTGLFGAWHDSSRLLWRHHADPADTELTRRSIEAIRAIETECGNTLLTEVGFLFTADRGLDEGILSDSEDIESLLLLDHTDLADRFAYLALSPGVVGYVEGAPSGYISPRGVVNAFVSSAAASGADVVQDQVTAVDVHADRVEVVISSGRRIAARKAVLATGAFSNTTQFLPRPVALRRKSETALMVELNLAKNPELIDMPTFVYELDSDLVSDIYMVPPMMYPNGKMMMKFGANTPHDRYLNDEEIQHWYREGDSAAVTPTMQKAFSRLFPSVDVDDWHAVRCVIARTPHGRPFIDTLVDGRLYCAIGGNGHSAKWAGAIGELAASLALTESWSDTVIPATHHRVQYADAAHTWKSRDLFM